MRPLLRSFFLIYMILKKNTDLELRELRKLHTVKILRVVFMLQRPGQVQGNVSLYNNAIKFLTKAYRLICILSVV